MIKTRKFGTTQLLVLDQYVSRRGLSDIATTHYKTLI